MGGCRCTYRNCSVKSDGTTHFFRYPVFDKYRCHQWLTNAKRLEFLNLKVSQLKNRVVCQHHFKDEMFMNFKKDKLTCFAVPTENGPFCDQNNDTNTINDVLHPINIEHIESEVINANDDKKATFSVKYGDFLTNCELMELTPLESENKTDEMLKTAAKKANAKPKTCRQPVIKIHFENEVEFTDKKYFIELDIPNAEKPNTESILNTDTGIENIVSGALEAATATYEDTTTGIQNIVTDKTEPAITTYYSDVTQFNQPNNSRKSNVNILSEEPFCPPLPEVPTLIPISPTSVLQVPFRIKSETSKSLINNDNVYQLESQENTLQAELLNQSPTVVAPSVEKEPTQNEPDQPYPTLKPNRNNHVPSPISQKSKGISNERTAAIQEKRKFNKKLRDIITDSLNLLDENDSKTKSDTRHEPEAPNTMNKQLIDFLDARINRMENKLLQQIESNSKQISELKNVMSHTKTSDMDVMSHTKTSDMDDELRKKSLFREISKYLTADAKSLVFEELFINRHVQPKLTPPELGRRSSKRRKL